MKNSVQYRKRPKAWIDNINIKISVKCITIWGII